MATTLTSSSALFRLFFLAALFFCPARADDHDHVLVTGTPALIIIIIIRAFVSRTTLDSH